MDSHIQANVVPVSGTAAPVPRARLGGTTGAAKLIAKSFAEIFMRDEDHFQRLIRLLELEGDAEARQARERSGRLSGAEAEKAGTSLVDLVVVDESSGLGGRCLLALVKRNRTLGLPWTRLQVGSPVLLSVQSAAAALAMTISRAGPRSPASNAQMIAALSSGPLT